MSFFYRIRQASTGLFSRGGAYPRFSTKGKTWSGMGPLKLHLLTVQRPYGADVEIVEYEEVESAVRPVAAVMDALNAYRRVRDAANRKTEAARRAREDKKQLKDLAEKLGAKVELP